MFSNIANFNNTGDYLPLLNGVLLTDMFVILLSNTRIRIFSQFSIFNFIALALVVQFVHDMLFYAFFKSVPRGMNRMLDTFKDYASEVSYKAVFADGGMMIMAALVASYLAGSTLNANIIVLIVLLYLLPYLLYN
jgi:hypothetical protein